MCMSMSVNNAESYLPCMSKDFLALYRLAVLGLDCGGRPGSSFHVHSPDPGQCVGPEAGLWVPGMHCACVTLPHCSGTWCAALDLSASLWSSTTPAPWGLNPELLLSETLRPSPGDMHQAPDTPKALGRTSQRMQGAPDAGPLSGAPALVLSASRPQARTSAK